MSPYYVLQSSADVGGMLMLAFLGASKRGHGKVSTEDVLEVFGRRGAPLLLAFAVEPGEVMASIAAKRGSNRRGLLSCEEEECQASGPHEAEVDALFREIEWRLRLRRILRASEPAPHFTTGVRAAVRAAFDYAESYGRRNVSLAHLLASLSRRP